MRSITKYFWLPCWLSGTAYTFAKSPTEATAIQQKTEDRHLSGFHAVDVGGSFDVYITQGSTESVKVEAPEEYYRPYYYRSGRRRVENIQ